MRALKPKICVLGVFVADANYTAKKQPRLGETVLGSNFYLGPGGKGSNQAVGVSRLAGEVNFLSRVGNDFFADIAFSFWKKENVNAHVHRDEKSYTGSAFIYINPSDGNNAIIIAPGAAEKISISDVNSWAEIISSSDVFLTQLEQPLEPVKHALEIARLSSVSTILNPAPGQFLDSEILSLCDIITPNETEAEVLSGTKVKSIESAKGAADILRSRGAKTVIITLGSEGALLVDKQGYYHQPAFNTGKIAETTGAGDSFNAGLAVAIAKGNSLKESLKFGCACGSLSVTKKGAATSMPTINEVQKLLEN